jgi:hypothetical protein
MFWRRQNPPCPPFAKGGTSWAPSQEMAERIAGESRQPFSVYSVSPWQGFAGFVRYLLSLKNSVIMLRIVEGRYSFGMA